MVSFPCSKALKDEIAKLAQADSRTVAAWLRLKLQDTIRRSRARRNA